MGTILGDVITAMYETISAAMPTVGVMDGPVATGAGYPQWVFIGASDIPAEPGATTIDGATSALPGYVTAEQLAIDVTIITWSGDDSIRDRRTEAIALLEQIDALLKPNNTEITLGLPEIAWARIGGTSYTPELRADTGSQCTLVATINVQARTATR